MYYNNIIYKINIICICRVCCNFYLQHYFDIYNEIKYTNYINYACTRIYNEISKYNIIIMYINNIKRIESVA